MADIRIGGAYVDVTSRNAQFLRGAQRNAQALRTQQRRVNALRRDIRAFNRAARTMASRFLSIRGAVATLAGAGGLGFLIRRQAQYGSSLVETSQRLGLTIERLQLLRRVFEGEGVAIRAADIGLQRFTRRLADAATGNRQLAETFRKLGVQTTRADGTLRDSYDALLDVAEGLRNTATQGERVLLAFQLFDTEGVAFVNALQRGRAALESQQGAFERLGVVEAQQARVLKALDQSYIDLANTLQASLAVAVASAAGELQRLNSTLASNLPGVFREVIQGVEFLIRNLREIGAAIGIAFGAFVVGRLARIGLGVTALVGQMGLLKAAIVGVTAVLRTLLLAFVPTAIVLGIIQVVRSFAILEEEIRRLGSSFGDVGAVAVSKFLAAFIRGAANLPALVVASLGAAGQTLIESARILGETLWEGIRAGMRGENIIQALLDGFNRAIDQAGGRVANVYDRIFGALRLDADTGAEGVARKVFGLTPAEFDAAGRAIVSTAERTIDQLLAIASGASGVFPLVDPGGGTGEAPSRAAAAAVRRQQQERNAAEETRNFLARLADETERRARAQQTIRRTDRARRRGVGSSPGAS